MAVELVEGPLPRPSDAAYVEARLLEALGGGEAGVGVSATGISATRRVRRFKLGRRLWLPSSGWSWIVEGCGKDRGGEVA